MIDPGAYRMRALDGGGIARQCPHCRNWIEDDTTEVEVAHVLIDGDRIPSYSTELGTENFVAHLATHSGDDVNQGARPALEG